jgi:hypothetical protein
MAPHGDRTAGSSDNPATNTGGISASGFASDPIYIMMGGINVGYAVIISTTTFHFYDRCRFFGLELILNWPRTVSHGARWRCA